MRQLAFSVHLCEHCNLNCAGCNNFSPLAEESYLDINQFEKDMARLSELSHGEAYRITLMGGEPLLNPSATEYARISRYYFPNGRISFLSNGILVKNMDDRFWDVCRENEIRMDLTPYPIDLDYKKLVEYVSGKGVSCGLFMSVENKVWTKEPLKLTTSTPRSHSTENWMKCYKPNDCVQLYNGKLACTTISCARHFVNYFKEEAHDVFFSDRDFVDIYAVKNIEEIFDFLSKPFPFCRYCVTGKTQVVEWRCSKKEIDEWIER